MTQTFPAGRMQLLEEAPKRLAHMVRLGNTIELDERLHHMLSLRASQINGCAFCIDMHWKDARAAGETEERLYLLDAWRESPLYDERERAALELCEAMTLISEGHVPDEVWERADAALGGELAQVVVRDRRDQHLEPAVDHGAGGAGPLRGGDARGRLRRPEGGNELRGEVQERQAPEIEFEEQRRLTFAIAYRMTGSVSDAEDIGQEALLRLQARPPRGEEVASPKAWLSTVATRLAIDHLRSARAGGRATSGPGCRSRSSPTRPARAPAEHAEVADTLSQAFLVLLETLSPVERAVFLLRDVFGYEYSQIAEAVGKSEENCRQIAARARRQVEGRGAALRGGPAARATSCSTASSRPARAATPRRWRRSSPPTSSSTGRRRQGHGGAAALLRQRPDRPFHGPDQRAAARVGRLPAAAGKRQRPAGPAGDRPGRQRLRRAHRSRSPAALIRTIRIVRNPDKLRHLQAPGPAPDGPDALDD